MLNPVNFFWFIKVRMIPLMVMCVVSIQRI